MSNVYGFKHLPKRAFVRLKVESVEEFAARGGRVEKCPPASAVETPRMKLKPIGRLSISRRRRSVGPEPPAKDNDHE